MTEEDELLDRAARAVKDTGDPNVLDDSVSILKPAKTFSELASDEESSLSKIRKEWRNQANAVSTTLDAMRRGYDARRAALVKTREDVVRQMKTQTAGVAPQPDSQAFTEAVAFLGSLGNGAGKPGDIVVTLRHAAAIAAESRRVIGGAAQAFSQRTVDVVDRLLALFALQYRRPQRRLRLSLYWIRLLRSLSSSLRAVITAAVYVVLFTAGRYFDPWLEGFIKRLIAGELLPLAALAAIIFAVECLKKVLFEERIEGWLRRFERRATAHEIHDLAYLAADLRILIAYFNKQAVAVP